MNPKKITVVGSINMDLVTGSPRFPKQGETLLGTSFNRFMGGKGANQAVAAARLGADVCMIGAVGNDGFGSELLAHLKQEGVDTAHVKILPHLPTGMANITVAGGDNHIIVVSGANFGITPADIETCEARIAESDVVLSQLEIPMECVITAAKLARKHGKPFVLNPAPAQKLPAGLLELVTLLTPNAYELAISLGLPEDTPVETLIRQAGRPVLMTRGSEGVVYNDDNGTLHRQPSFKVTPVDTTGAGDTFNGAFAVFLHEGMATAVRKACAAAALSVTKAGAQGGMPTLAELEAFLAQQK
ncbi:Ribokinase [Neisseria animaloris]|uniref:ribokinase n=1 Tax=Neisseria animaloris TaxID=326522 RepID=UPI000A195E4D|nr:ribokinase [Neisseria animaloris]OSI07665.1 ribokinase [Neisseria animaloris]VEH88292.1 Ribokinase [Neisseria animaloris]